MKPTFQAIINSSTPVLIDFYADWSVPSQKQSPLLEQVVKELGGKFRIVKVDIDNNPQVAMDCQIRRLPMLAVFKDGKELYRAAGPQTKEQLVNGLKGLL